MKRYILTGAPGAGKTAILRQLEADGWPVVEEAATDVNLLGHARGDAEPWKAPGFIDEIVALQVARQRRAAALDEAVQVFDRSPVCTLALCRFLDRLVPDSLRRELARIEAGRLYRRQVLFVRNLGFCTPTSVRRISFEDSLRFETLHEEAYRELGYELVEIAPAALADRAAAVVSVLTG